MAKHKNIQELTTRDITIELQQRLTGTKANTGVDIASFKQEFGISDKEFEKVMGSLDIMEGPGNEHFVVVSDGKTLTWNGRGEQFKPLKLQFGETLVLTQLLSSPNISEKDREVLKDLIPDKYYGKVLLSLPEVSPESTVGALLKQAIDKGRRCSIVYRKKGGAVDGPFTIDAKRIFPDVNGTMYVQAWNVEKDGERTYRLDRIESIELLKTKLRDHDYIGTEDDPFGFKKREVKVKVRVTNGVYPYLKWEAMGRAKKETDKYMVFPVYVQQKEWFFDQVLSRAGSIKILEPQEMVDEFKAYAEKLIS